jgi:hypothetical protein
MAVNTQNWTSVFNDLQERIKIFEQIINQTCFRSADRFTFHEEYLNRIKGIFSRVIFSRVKDKESISSQESQDIQTCKTFFNVIKEQCLLDMFPNAEQHKQLNIPQNGRPHLSLIQCVSKIARYCRISSTSKSFESLFY